MSNYIVMTGSDKTLHNICMYCQVYFDWLKSTMNYSKHSMICWKVQWFFPGIIPHLHQYAPICTNASTFYTCRFLINPNHLIYIFLKKRCLKESNNLIPSIHSSLHFKICSVLISLILNPLKLIFANPKASKGIKSHYALNLYLEWITFF